MIRFLKPLSFIPALVLMYMIFGFSAQDGQTSSQLSYKVTHKVIEVGNEVLDAGFQPWEIDSLTNRFEGVVRKLAHMTEYFALAVAVAFPLYVYGLRGILLLFIAGFICVAFACGDEYHQSFVAGRGPSKRDVLIDSFGVFWGIILVRIIGWTGRKTIFRPFSRKKKRGNELPPAAEPQYQSVPPYPQNAPYRNVPPYPSNAPYQNVPPYPSNASYQNVPPYPEARRIQGAAPYQQNPQYQGAAPFRQGTQYSGAASYQQTPPSVYPPGSVPYGYTSNGYGNSAASYGNPVHPGGNSHSQTGGYGPANGGKPQPSYPDDADVSDRLSEDMSLRKLMHDIKDQKKAAHKPRLDDNDIVIEDLELDDD